MRKRTTIEARTVFQLNAIEVLLTEHREDGTYHAQPLMLMEAPANHECVNPTMKLTRDEAQQLVDELWRCGVYQTNGAGSAGSLQATQRHLEDMRAITFGTLVQAGFDVKAKA